jgi:hypothetical protein
MPAKIGDKFFMVAGYFRSYGKKSSASFEALRNDNRSHFEVYL